MTAFNVVRFRIKPGSENAFLEAHRKMTPDFKGFLGAYMVKTGDNTFCFVGQWRNFQSIVAARPGMISMLDTVRGHLEDLGADMGVTDPVSGEAVLRLGPPPAPKKKAAAKKKAAPKKRPAKKGATKAKAAKKRKTTRASKKR